MDAQNVPVRRPPAEISSSDVKIDQKPTIVDREDTDSEIVIAPEVLNRDYQEALKFMEDPITIVVTRSSEKYAPHVIDCWVNGKGAEVLMNGKWVETRAIPVGMPVTTKRKYAEVLLRSKTDTVNTKVHKREDSEVNEVERYTSARAPLQVLKDANPKGTAWMMDMARLNF